MCDMRSICESFEGWIWIWQSGRRGGWIEKRKLRGVEGKRRCDGDCDYDYEGKEGCLHCSFVSHSYDSKITLR
jgi:hypothetical protein